MVLATWPKERLRWHLRDRTGLYALATGLVVAGLIVGVMAVSALSPLQRADLLDYIGAFLSQIGSGLPSGPVLMRLAIGQELQGLAILWLLGLTIIGLPLALLLLLFRGFVFGFTAAFMVQELGGRGLTLLLTGVLPAALLVLPASMMVAVAACRFAGQVAGSRLGTRGPLGSAVVSYLMASIVPLLLVLAASFVEAYLTPLLLGSLSGYLHG